MSLHLDNNSRSSRENTADSGQTEEFVLEDLLDGPVKRPSASKIYKSPEAKAADTRTTALSFFHVPRELLPGFSLRFSVRGNQSQEKGERKRSCCTASFRESGER